MKLTAWILTLMLPVAAMAESGAELTCIETSSPAGRAFVLRKVTAETLLEGQQYPLEVELREFANLQPEEAIPVTATQEDVILNFASADGRVSGVVFKDELDQTALNVNGESIGFTCQ